jgi:OOP family OmpA-OmpF porin
MKTYPETTAVIEGHTDNVGKEESNLRLSTKRAESVRTYLTEKFGIAENRLSARGYGSSRPVADNATPEGRQRNRRIEAVIETTITR